MLQQINKENFNQMLGQFSTAELEGMLEKFPYFQQAHLLLAKKYQQENSPKFDQQLQLAALYIQDRDLLYSLFNERNTIASQPAQKAQTIERDAPIVQIEEKTAETFTPVLEQKEEEQITPALAVTKQELTITTEAETDIEEHLKQIEESARQISLLKEDKTEEPKEDVIAVTLSPVIETVAVTTDEPVIEALAAELPVIADAVSDTHLEEQLRQIEESAKEINLLRESKEEEKIIEIVEKPVIEQNEPIAEPHAIITEEEVEEVKTETTGRHETAIEEEPEEETETETPVAPAFSRIAPHTFDEWLKAFNSKSTPPAQSESVVLEDKKEQQEEEEEDGPDELDQLLAVNVSADYLHDLVKEETSYAKGLERFIEEQIQKHKQPVAKKPVPEKDIKAEPATETMAKVYEMQKKYLKAIQTYEALTLKFPEKSSFFAARINYLRNII